MVTLNLDSTQRRPLFEWGFISPKRATSHASPHPSENCRLTYMLHSKLLCVPSAKGSGEVPCNIAKIANPVGLPNAQRPDCQDARIIFWFVPR